MPNNLTVKFGENVRRIRESKQMTQHYLAKHAGVSLSLLNWLEVGKRTNVTFKTAEKIGKVLDTPVVKLIS